MKSFALFQIQITQDMRDHINTFGWEALSDLPAFETKQELSIRGSSKFVPVRHDIFFEQVSTITAENLEDVFRVGNLGPEDQIERFAPMHSPSIGDVVVDMENGRSFMVDPFGFERIVFNMNIAKRSK
jgi:hypothetical protein